MKNKIYAIDLIVLVGSLVVILGIVGYATPLIISPSDNSVTANNSVLFSFEKGSAIMIDDNKDFSSPEIINVENNLVINLKPGHYYWKVKGLLQSEIREFTIQSEVELKLKEAGNKFEVVNAGNVELNVDIYNNESLNGSIILKVDENKNVSGTKFIGSQNE